MAEAQAQELRHYNSMTALHARNRESDTAQTARNHEAGMRQMSDHFEQLRRDTSEKHGKQDSEPLERSKAPEVDAWLLVTCGIHEDGERKEIVDLFVNPDHLNINPEP